MESRVWTSLDTQRARLSGLHSRVFPSIATSRLLISPSLVVTQIFFLTFLHQKFHLCILLPKTQYNKTTPLQNFFLPSKVDQYRRINSVNVHQGGYRVSRVVYTSPLSTSPPNRPSLARGNEESSRRDEERRGELEERREERMCRDAGTKGRSVRCWQRIASCHALLPKNARDILLHKKRQREPNRHTRFVDGKKKKTRPKLKAQRYTDIHSLSTIEWRGHRGEESEAADERPYERTRRLKAPEKE